ncbi:MAG: hypothetical protein ACPG1A_11305 [Halioglobus sp.]
MELLLFVAIAGIAIFLLLKRSNAKGEASQSLNSRKTTAKGAVQAHAGEPFKATSIVAGPDACDAALALADKLYLDSDRSTPNLPLPNCTAPRCRCKYSHHPDRRNPDGDRRFGSMIRSGRYALGQDDRRASKGRRSED